LLGLGLGAAPAGAYSQVTHEELIDILWADFIQLMLLKRYPGATPQALTRAHAFAYGGCLIQDIGYYPFGKRFFSDLAHYVRSGDFVAAMLRNARSIDELAFAVGALSHYLGDSIAHSQAVNPSTALTFPELRARYGAIVTYEEAPIGHVRTELGFDVAQTAWQRYAPQVYRKHIGFRVARQLLYRTFHEIYGVRARGILGPARSALSSYRWAVTVLLPAFLHAQVVLLRHDLPMERDDEARAQFLKEISRTEYAAKWQPPYYKPGIRAHLLAFVVIIIPKIGPLKVLATKSPIAETEDLFLRSANEAVGRFREVIGRLSERRTSDVQPPDLDLDTGYRATPGESRLVDETYAKLVIRIADERVPISSELRNHLLSYFSNGAEGPPLKLGRKDQKRLTEALHKLRDSAAAADPPSPIP